MSSTFQLLNKNHSLPMPSLTPTYPGLLPSPMSPREILSSPNSSFSITATSLSESLQYALYSCWYLSRTVKPSMQDSPLLTPPSLSCLWIGGLTELWSYSCCSIGGPPLLSPSNPNSINASLQSMSNPIAQNITVPIITPGSLVTLSIPVLSAFASYVERGSCGQSMPNCHHCEHPWTFQYRSMNNK